MRKILLRVTGVALLLLFAIGGWWLFLDGRPPAVRTDLVRMPASFGPPPVGYPTENALMVAYLTGFLEILDPNAPVTVPDGVIEETDVEYGRVGDRPLLLDLYRPKDSDQPLPALLFIHGGGWRKGDKSDYKFYAARFPEKGYVVATMGYRFVNEAKFPGCVSDAKCAVRWLRANAERLKIDPNRIAVAGGSAGGHLAMMVGSSDDPALEGDGGNPEVSSAVQAVIDLYGPTDLTTPVAQATPSVNEFMGVSYAENPKRYEMASPILHLDKNDPPTFIIQGTLDALVPVAQSDALAEKFQALGMDYWYDCYPGWPHTMDVAPAVNERVQATIHAFLQEVFSANKKGTNS